MYKKFSFLLLLALFVAMTGGAKAQESILFGEIKWKIPKDSFHLKQGELVDEINVHNGFVLAKIDSFYSFNARVHIYSAET
jgi:hypothetical protein